MTKTYVAMSIFVCLACRQKIFLGREAAERQLNEALENPNQIDPNIYFPLFII